MALNFPGTLAERRSTAKAQVAEYPQYDDAYFAQFNRVVRLRRSVSSAMGQAFGKDEISIAEGKFERAENGKVCITVWSFATKIATQIAANNVTFVDGQPKPADPA